MLLFSCIHVEEIKIVIVFYCCVFLVRRSHKTARNRCCVTTLIMYLKVKSRKSRKKSIYIHNLDLTMIMGQFIINKRKNKSEQ